MIIDSYRYAVSGPSDPDFASVISLIKVEDSIVDVIGVASNALIGAAAISTDQAKFGTKSIKNNGTSTEGQNGFVLTGASDYFRFPGDFTWEMWVYLTSSPGEFDNIISTKSTASGFFQVAVNNQTLWWNGPGSGALNGGANSLTINAWHHLAVVRNGTASGNLKVYVDGVAKITASVGSNMIGMNISSQSSLCFGGGQAPLASDNGDIRGLYEEIRITKGVARYTSNFTPTTDPFPDH